MMRGLIFLILSSVAAMAQTPQDTLQKVKRNADIARMVSADKRMLEKSCIMASAERLPKIPGIVITGSKAIGAPTDAPKDPAAYTNVVEIGVTAAGQEATYRFICVADYTGRALISPDGVR